MTEDRNKPLWEHPILDPVNGQSLLQRIGGVQTVHDFIYGFYDRLLYDKKVSPLLKRSQQTQNEAVYIKLLKDRTVEYLESVWGGDPWEGQDMFVAHAQLHISPEIYDICIVHSKKQLAGMKLSKELKAAVQAEVILLAEPIADPGGKLDAWVRKRNKDIEDACLAEGDVKGPMGFSISAAQAKAMKDKAEMEAARKAKLLAMRQEREAAQKQEKKQQQKQEDLSSDATKTRKPKKLANASDDLKEQQVQKVEGKTKSAKTMTALSKDKASETKLDSKLTLKVTAPSGAIKEADKKRETKGSIDASVMTASTEVPLDEPPQLPDEVGLCFVPASLCTPTLLVSKPKLPLVTGVLECA